MPRLVCPRISPQWELAAQLALVKPKPYTKDKIAHRHPRQPWPRNARRIIEKCVNGSVAITFPRTGEHRMIAELSDVTPAQAKRFARRLSRCLPELWFALDELYLRDGVVYARTGRYNLELVRTNRTRLRRAVRFGFLGDVDDAVTSTRHRAGENQPAQSDR
jgi:hypothetical protein